MKRLLKTVMATGLAIAVSAAAAAEVSFKADIIPVLKSRCIVCHLPGGAQGGLSLHPGGGYDALVGVPSTGSPLLRVSPGKPDESYLIHKLQGTQASVGGQGEKMPFGEAPLTDEQIGMIRQWIESGAPLN